METCCVLDFDSMISTRNKFQVLLHEWGSSEKKGQLIHLIPKIEQPNHLVYHHLWALPNLYVQNSSPFLWHHCIKQHQSSDLNSTSYMHHHTNIVCMGGGFFNCYFLRVGPCSPGRSGVQGLLYIKLETWKLDSWYFKFQVLLI